MREIVPKPNLEEGRKAYNEGDYAKALEIWKALAIEGDPKAQNNLGILYQQGNGVPKDLDEAENWYQMAADQGNLIGKQNLAIIKDEKDGSPVGLKESNDSETIETDISCEKEKTDKSNEELNVIANISCKRCTTVVYTYSSFCPNCGEKINRENWDVNKLSVEEVKTLKLETFPKFRNYEKKFINNKGNQPIIEINELEDIKEEIKKSHYILQTLLIIWIGLLLPILIDLLYYEKNPISVIFAITIFVVLIFAIKFISIRSKNKILQIFIEKDNLVVTHLVGHKLKSKKSFSLGDIKSVHISPADPINKMLLSPRGNPEQKGIGLYEVQICVFRDWINFGYYLENDKLVWLCLAIIYIVQHEKIFIESKII